MDDAGFSSLVEPLAGSREAGPCPNEVQARNKIRTVALICFTILTSSSLRHLCVDKVPSLTRAEIEIDHGFADDVVAGTAGFSSGTRVKSESLSIFTLSTFP